MKILKWVFILYAGTFGLFACADVTLVLLGYTIPVYTEYLSWQNSPIFHYNVSTSANLLMGMMGGMGLFAATLLLTINKTK